MALDAAIERPDGLIRRPLPGGFFAYTYGMTRVGLVRATPLAAVPRRARWADQPQRVEVWIEKDALVGVFEPVCQELDVPLLSCRGYTSQSEVGGAAQRLEAYLQAGQEVVILHFGDHDPSGLDMTRDIEERLRLLLLHDRVGYQGDNHTHMPREERRAWLIAEHPSQGWDIRLDVRRLALTWDQVQQYSPPPNPAKSTDARYRKYAEEHGHESWELDALEPTVLGQLPRRDRCDPRR